VTATVPGMADKGWTARVATAAGAAAGTGAAQLGLGYGLGVVVWPVAGNPDRSAWLGSLGWATWITASATVFGAVIASRLGGPPPTRSRGPWRFALAASAGVGALVAVALIALPARSPVRLDSYPPQTIAAGYALLGVVFGVLVAYWAVLSRPVAANLMATAAWLWGLAITAIVVELSLHRDSATYLTSWQFADATSGGRYGTIYWPSAILTLGAAFLVGMLTAVPAARRGDLGVGAATSGAVGPLLVAASFLVLAPRLTGALGPIESAYLIAPYAVLAGLAGSALAVASGQAVANRRARRASDRPDDSGAIDPDDEDRTEELAPATTAKSPNPTGRAKLPAQSSTSSAQAATPAQSRPTGSSTEALSRPTGPSPAGPSPTGASSPNSPSRGSTGAPARSSSPTSTPARSSSSTGSPARGSSPTGSPARASSSTSTSSGTASSSASSTGASSTGASSTGSPAATNPPRPVKSAPSPQAISKPPAQPRPAERTPFADPEIAEAARSTGRPRAKKATAANKSPDPKQVKSTVTPPPSAPTVAQINPKPPAD
jgi:hypothetical protein